MAYADQQMSGNRLAALIIVVLIHVVVGYLLVTGLAYEGFKQAVKHMTTVDVKEPDKKPPPPPPPPKKDVPPPPIVAPPPPVQLNTTPPPVQTVTTPPPPAPVLVTKVEAPPPPPEPRFTPKSAEPRGRIGDWVTTDDYPAGAQREGHQGTTGISVTISPEGRVTGCTVTSSSGDTSLDSAACTYFSRRARFTPATDGEGKPTSGHFSTRIRWQLPPDQ